MTGSKLKQYPENFAILKLRILQLFTREVWICLKFVMPLFNIFYCFCMFVNKHFVYSGAYISKSKQCQNAKPSVYYFYVNMKILIDFHICIGVPLIITI